MTVTQPDGFYAVPRSNPRGAVLVLHPWWGLNETMKTVCTRLADHGYHAFAVDLYHGRTADTVEAAEALSGELARQAELVRADIDQAVAYLGEHASPDDRRLAVVGFSMGAFYALDLSARDPDHIRSVVIFYGTGPTDFSKSQASYLGHFAEKDEYEPAANVDELEESLRQAGRPVTFHRYSGTGHWFFEPDRRKAYHPAAADLAWERTLAFLEGSFQTGHR